MNRTRTSPWSRCHPGRSGIIPRTLLWLGIGIGLTTTPGCVSLSLPFLPEEVPRSPTRVAVEPVEGGVHVLVRPGQRPPFTVRKRDVWRWGWWADLPIGAAAGAATWVVVGLGSGYYPSIDPGIAALGAWGLLSLDVLVMALQRGPKSQVGKDDPAAYNTFLVMMAPVLPLFEVLVPGIFIGEGPAGGAPDEDFAGASVRIDIPGRGTYHSTTPLKETPEGHVAMVPLSWRDLGKAATIEVNAASAHHQQSIGLPGSWAARMRRGAPPELQVTLSPENGAEPVVVAANPSEILLTVAAKGKLGARGVVARLNRESGFALGNLGVPGEVAIGDLAPGEIRTLRVPISAGPDLADSSFTLRATLEDEGGLLAPVANLSLQTRSLPTPTLMVVPTLSGQLSPGVINPQTTPTLELSFKNTGAFATGPLVAALALDRPVPGLELPAAVQVRSLSPGDAETIRVSLRALATLASAKADLVVMVKNARGSSAPGGRLHFTTSGPKLGPGETLLAWPNGTVAGDGSSGSPSARGATGADALARLRYEVENLERLAQRGATGADALARLTSRVRQRATAELALLRRPPQRLDDLRKQLEATRPGSPPLVKKGEFETTAEFESRVRKARAERQDLVDLFNKDVARYQAELDSFLVSCPARLPFDRLATITGESLQEVFGSPALDAIRYDADGESFFADLAPASAISALGLPRAVAIEGVPRQAAPRAKESLSGARPVVVFKLDAAGKLQFQDAWVDVSRDGTRRYSLLPVDPERAPAAAVARIPIEPATDRPLPDIRPLSADFIIDPVNDPAIAEKSRKLAELRARQRAQRLKKETNAALDAEIASLESEGGPGAQEIGAGPDDLIARIAALPNSQPDKKRFLVAVGIRKYATQAEVPFADAAAQRFEDLARRLLGVPKENTVILLNEDATGTRLKARLNNLLNRINPGDVLYFYYAGHGFPGRDGKSSYMLPFDAEAGVYEDEEFRLDRILLRLADTRAAKVLAILDTCFSGRTGPKTVLFKGVAPVFAVSTSVLPAPDRMAVLTAGKGDQLANALPERSSRLMSYHLIRGLLDGKSDLANLFHEVKTEVDTASRLLGVEYTQTPTLLGNSKLSFR